MLSVCNNVSDFSSQWQKVVDDVLLLWGCCLFIICIILNNIDVKERRDNWWHIYNEHTLLMIFWLNIVWRNLGMWHIEQQTTLLLIS